MIGSTYKPLKVSDFEASKLNFLGIGVTASCTSNGVTTLDYILIDDCLITGGTILVSNGTFGDKIDLQIVDVNNTLGYGANFILNKFVSGWYIQSGPSIVPISVPYPAKVYAGLAIRIIYTSIGSSTNSLAVNYNLHKVLV